MEEPDSNSKISLNLNRVLLGYSAAISEFPTVLRDVLNLLTDNLKNSFRIAVILEGIFVLFDGVLCSYRHQYPYTVFRFQITSFKSPPSESVAVKDQRISLSSASYGIAWIIVSHEEN